MFEKISIYFPTFIDAFLETLKMGFLGVIFSLILGTLLVLVKYFKIKVISLLTSIYIEFSRNTPLLIQVFILYFALPKIGVTLSADSCGIIGLTFLGGSYMFEALESGIENIKLGQKESALSLGLTNWKVFCKVIVPQSSKLSIAPIFANIVFLIKETSILSTITICELTFRAYEVINISYDTAPALFLLCIFYALIILPLLFIYYRLLSIQQKKWVF